MTLEKITRKDIEDAIDALTPAGKGATCWYKKIATTDDGTVLCFVVGWSDAGFDKEFAVNNGFYDDAYGTICGKIAYQHSNNAMQTDYDLDWLQPYDMDTMDVFETDYLISNEPSTWAHKARSYNADAQDIWDIYGETGKLDLMESNKKKESVDAGGIYNLLLRDFPESEIVRVPEKDNDISYAFEIDGFLVWVRKDGLKVATENETDNPVPSDFVTSYIQYVSDEHGHYASEGCNKNKGENKMKSSMQKKKESLICKQVESVDDDAKAMIEDLQKLINTYIRGGANIKLELESKPGQDYVVVYYKGAPDVKVPVGGTSNAYIVRDVYAKIMDRYF